MEKERNIEHAHGTYSDAPTGTRNRFFRGKQMRAEEYTLEQDYFIQRRRLLNRAVSGWGVVFGLALEDEGGARRIDEALDEHDVSASQEAKPVAERASAEIPKIPGSEIPKIPGSEIPKVPVATTCQVSRGLALDRHGREIAVEHPLVIGARNTFELVHGDNGNMLKSVESIEPGEYLLSVHYAERRLGDAHLADSCSCALPEKNFVHETAVFSLQPLCANEPCRCAEATCGRQHHCGPRDDCSTAGRGPHSQICHWLTEVDVAQEPSPLCCWNEYWISPNDPVPLACVKVTKSGDPCAPLALVVIDSCNPRRLVKNNDLLYDLLRGCDLTRIQEISWSAWHRAKDPINWDEFRKAFGTSDGTQNRDPIVSTTFTVTFSNPVVVTSLTPETIVMTTFTREQATGWLLPRRVPSTVESWPTNETLPKGLTDRVRLNVGRRWRKDEIEGDKESWLTEVEFAVEIEIRGDLILDCNLQSVDANAHKISGVPTGNGTPGGTFISTFRVQPKPLRSEESTDGRYESRNT